ncbi:MAG: hypothetical protein M3R12_02940 [Actinomycetota bacterium]|nr:hypothetical protein [Actinomycetota bacterium]
MDARLSGAMTEVRSLLDLPQGAELPPRAIVEDTLTTGYAYALDLEGERLRIERQLRSLLRSGDPAGAEVKEAAGRLEVAVRELAHVRALLSSLRSQALN